MFTLLPYFKETITLVLRSDFYIFSILSSGTYEITEFPAAERGTKIVIHLKSDCREFADDQTVLSVIKKYSNFVNSPIFVNEEQTNKIQVAHEFCL